MDRSEREREFESLGKQKILYKSSPELLNFFLKHGVDRNRAQSVAFYASRLEMFTVHQLHRAMCKNDAFLEDLGMNARCSAAIKLALHKLSIIHVYNL
jgi:hypothetical protein